MYLGLDLGTSGVKALASGRLTVDDWNAMRQGNSTDNLIKVVRGRK